MKKNILDKIHNHIVDKTKVNDMYNEMVALSATMLFIHICDDLEMTREERDFMFRQAYPC